MLGAIELRNQEELLVSAVLDGTLPRSSTRKVRTTSSDWETPTGPVEADRRPRATPPQFVYRGYGDAHWRGQTCHVVGSRLAEELSVVLACGCEASVPWWTLEPRA